ncbi:MAG TPA: hypothetical protein VN672_07750 [Solirubrobacteraceae bacterium]|nr:hypothetical protein [Solirubrobacteraceae bacterium]
MLPIEVVPVLIAVAILGYVVGHSGGKAGSSEHKPTAGAEAALGYPAGWRMATTAPGIPQLSIAKVIVVAPHGDAARAGLMIGGLPAGDPAPLPASFVATLPRPPLPQVVNLAETQAYKYSHLEVPGYGRELTLFVIPNPGGRAMVLACYAAAAGSTQLHTCEQSVATVTLVGQPQADQLTPEPRYAGRVSAAIAQLDRARASLKVLHDASLAEAQRLASKLAAGYDAAAAALGTVQPPTAASSVHATLSEALARAHEGYVALAAAIGDRDRARYVAAQKRVESAEAAVDTALGGFALLGYGSPAQPGSAS